MQAKHTERTDYIMAEMKKGKTREEIATTLNYKDIAGLDMYMRRHHFIWNRQEKFYIPASPGLQFTRLQPANQNATCKKIISLLKKQLDLKIIAKKTGFPSIRDLGAFMKSYGYNWLEAEQRYVYHGITNSPLDTPASRASTPNSKPNEKDEKKGDTLLPLLQFLKENEEQLRILITETELQNTKSVNIRLPQDLLEQAKTYISTKQITLDMLATAALKQYLSDISANK